MSDIEDIPLPKKCEAWACPVCARPHMFSTDASACHGCIKCKALPRAGGPWCKVCKPIEELKRARAYVRKLVKEVEVSKRRLSHAIEYLKVLLVEQGAEP